MILINLLPHREQARKRRKDAFNVSLLLAALVGGALAAIIFLWFQQRIDAQLGRNAVLQSEIKRFDAQIKDIAGLEGEISALRARQQAVEDLQADRNMPVYLLTDLVRLLPDGTYITSMRQQDQQITLIGVAASNDRVSQLLSNLGNESPWFAKPQLIEIVAGSVAMSPREQRRVANFNIRVNLVRNSERPPGSGLAQTAQLPASAASNARAAASAAIDASLASARAATVSAASQAVYGTVAKLSAASAAKPAQSAPKAAGG